MAIKLTTAAVFVLIGIPVKYHVKVIQFNEKTKLIVVLIVSESIQQLL